MGEQKKYLLKYTTQDNEIQGGVRTIVKKFDDLGDIYRFCRENHKDMINIWVGEEIVESS